MDARTSELHAALARERDRADELARRLFRQETELAVWRARAGQGSVPQATGLGWELYLKLVRLRLRLAPTGSLRERVLRAGLRRLRRRAAPAAPHVPAPRVSVPRASRDVLIVSGRPGATKRYRCDHRAEELELAGLTVDVVLAEEVALEQVVAGYSCVFLHRVAYDGFVAKLLDRAAEDAIPVVYDTDDLLFDADAEANVPDPGRHHDGVLRQRLTLRSCGAVTVSTEPLADRARPFHERVTVWPNAVSRRMVELSDDATEARGGAGKTLAYLSGTPTHERDFLVCADAVLWALERDAEARFLAVGRIELDARFDAFRERVERIGFQDWEDLPRVLARVDVNLAPLERGNPFAECKSCVKYLEAALVAVPTIASPRADYARVIEHGWNGMLAETPGEWQQAVAELLDSPDRRTEIGAAARANVLEHHTTSASSAHALDLLAEVAPGSKAAALR